jgi:hypothetical protein
VCDLCKKCRDIEFVIGTSGFYNQFSTVFAFSNSAWNVSWMLIRWITGAVFSVGIEIIYMLNFIIFGWHWYLRSAVLKTPQNYTSTVTEICCVPHINLSILCCIIPYCTECIFYCWPVHHCLLWWAVEDMPSMYI